MPYREPLDVAGYIDALGDDEAELSHVVTLSDGYSGGEPRLCGDGPANASMCTDLSRRDELVWDPNRYYRDLGFPDTIEMVLGGYRRITRGDILRAVKKRGVEVQSVRQGYCAKQLLNRETRREYNEINLGHMYFDDYWADFFKKAAQEQSRAFKQQGVDLSEEDLLTKWGLDPQPKYSFEEPETFTFSDPEPEPEPAPIIESDWDWSFYVWRATSVNLRYMENWQRLLLNSLRQNRRMGRRYVDLPHFAVGVMGFGNNPNCPEYTVRAVGEDWVFFLRSDVSPSKNDARNAIKQAINDTFINVGVGRVREEPAQSSTRGAQ